ncbi:DNA-3-methyladenine glycosylase family protein [Oricola sp.]|uniref:DNA-3-methyladenine glycosylase family protein n=1 Tax=Oricola sp. TaxID=1979950 RepID=UPI003BACFEB1
MQPINTAADIAAGLDGLATADPRLAPVIDAVPDIPLRRSEAGFASLASVVVSQQVSKASAAAIWERLTALVDPLEPRGFLDGGEAAWREAGLSRPKQAALIAISEAVLAGRLDLVRLCDIEPQQAIERMTAIKGIGPWTAETYLLFAAGHPDIFPAGDVALRAAVADAFGLAARPEIAELRVIAESWTPWRSVAARLFWAFYAQRRNRDVLPV